MEVIRRPSRGNQYTGKEIIPGVKFGIKYTSARRQTKDDDNSWDDSREPLSDLTNSSSVTLDQHEAQSEEEEKQEEEEEKEVKPNIKRAKRSRLEIPGLLHPDDLIPSRSNKRRGGRGGKKQRGQLGHDHTKDVISFIKKTHNTMYGEGNSGRSSLHQHHHNVSSHQHTHHTPSLNTFNHLSYGNVAANPISESWTGKENRSQGRNTVRPLWAHTGDLHKSHSVLTDSRVPDSDHHSELEANSSCSLYPGEEEYARTNRSIIDRIMFQDREEREDISSRLMWQRETGYDTTGGSMTDGQGQQLTEGLVCQGKKDVNNGGRNVNNNNDLQSEVPTANFIHVHPNTNTSDFRPFPSQFKTQADKQSSNCFESLLEDISPTRYTSERRENYDTIKSSMTTGDFLQEIVSNNCQAHSVSPRMIFSKTTEQTGTENTMYGLIDRPTNDSAQNHQRNPFMIHQTNSQASIPLDNSIIHNAHEWVNPLDNNNNNNQHHNGTQNNHHYYQNIINTNSHQHDNYNTTTNYRESKDGPLFGDVEYNEEERSKGQRVPSPDLFATQDFADGQRSKSTLPNFRPHNIFSANPHVGTDPPPPDSSSRSSFPSCLPSTPPKHISKHPSQVSPPPPQSPYFVSHHGPLHSSYKTTLSQTPLPVTPNSHDQTGGEEGPQRILFKTPQANPHRSGQHFFFSPKSAGYQSGWSGSVRGGRVQVVRVESQMVVNATPHNKLETTKAQVVSSYLLDSQGNDLQRAHALLPTHHHHHHHHHPVLDLYTGVPYP
ncbi:hypothetical protein Pmani_018903 [Petrolisthes manimaculis]|uniref:Uncharacterized protein n=1 Tax=Petrolisthes manimaculis TaxID=1843537 RepID=A0AAE1PK19_9EUCA|nr:hypothetical protein Pmani_018903 [Petrolisthes manimaculis]